MNVVLHLVKLLTKPVFQYYFQYALLSHEEKSAKERAGAGGYPLDPEVKKTL